MFHSTQQTEFLLSPQSMPFKTNSLAPADGLENLSLGELSYLEPSKIDPENRLNVMLALRRALGTKPVSLTLSQSTRLATLCQYLCDWHLLVYLIENQLWCDKSIESIMPYVMIGDNSRALKRLEKIKAYLNNTKLTQNLIEELSNEHQSNLSHQGIRLVPLKAHHIADFIWQYADSSIAKLCNLPQFPDPSAWLSWLWQCNQDWRQHLFAVLHPSLGFVGSVSIHICGEYGFFYYWLGKDFRGLGIGPIAVSTLLKYAQEKHHIKGCFTKIYKHNTASHKGVAKMTFSRLPFHALSPDEHEVFYYRGQSVLVSQLKTSLQQVLNELNAGIFLK